MFGESYCPAESFLCLRQVGYPLVDAGQLGAQGFEDSGAGPQQSVGQCARPSLSP